MHRFTRGKPKADKVRNTITDNDKPVNKYKLTDEIIRQTWLFTSKFGASSKDLSDFFGIPRYAIDKWIKIGREKLVEGKEDNIYGRFLIAVKSGTDAFNTDHIEKALVQKAKGYDYSETTIEHTELTVKELRRMGIEVPEALVNEGKVIRGRKVKKVHKHQVPDTQAISFYLQNRAGNRWKNVKSSEINIRGGVDHRHLHGFINGADPALVRKEQGKIDVTTLSDEQLEVLEQAIPKEARILNEHEEADTDEGNDH